MLKHMPLERAIPAEFHMEVKSIGGKTDCWRIHFAFGMESAGRQ
jgi:hypothetical protein